MNKLVSIRGAVTALNSEDGIRNASVKLIEKLYFKNGLTDENVINIMFSVTDDLTAFSPARAVRESGRNVTMMSCIEPDIDGALKRCIRIMVTAYSDNAVKHVYLNGARMLRPDLTSAYSIALDGPSGAGKSTVAKAVSEKLKITYLDTGALYRALGLKCLTDGVDVADGAAVERCLSDVDVTIDYKNGAQRVMLDGNDVSGKIRTPEVSMAASAVSAVPYVRRKLLGIQREIAANSSVILDGRDIGTVVLPNAEFKFFLTASAQVRAKRRFDELTAKGQDVKYENVLNDVITRDRNDSTRACAPLKRAYDAIEIDSDDMTAEQVVETIIGYIAEDMA